MPPDPKDDDKTFFRTQEPWPEAHFGSVDAPLPNPKAAEDDPDPDDEELDETPEDVVMMLGFDPKGEKTFDGGNDLPEEGAAEEEE